MTKAGDGNRTHMTSLEGWGFTIKLRPQHLVKHDFTFSCHLPAAAAVSPLLSARNPIGDRTAVYHKLSQGITETQKMTHTSPPHPSSLFPGPFKHFDHPSHRALSTSPSPPLPADIPLFLYPPAASALASG